ncbi:MAG TPA: FHA domain-containing protein [Propionibacteriaceae bacterium]|jgi:hypothetical protein
MTTVLAKWRASYAPGAWIVLAGPTSLVVLEPPASGWTPLLDTIWDAVLDSASLPDLADRLAGFGLSRMPSFGAFFWTPDGMRSLVRGEVVVQDASSGATVADGLGIQTWSEIGLSGVGRVMVRPGRAGEQLERQLPLVVGVAYASSVTLDAGPHAVVRSAQPLAEMSSADPQPDSPDLAGDDQWAMENGATELMPVSSAESDDEEDPGETTEPLQDFDDLPVATLVMSDGNRFDLSGPIRIGRAPSASTDESGVLLVTVLSPEQDISRSHVQVEPWDGSVVVTDLRSTNGTILVRPGGAGAGERLIADEPVLVPTGSVLELGDGVRVSIEPARQPT